MTAATWEAGRLYPTGSVVQPASAPAPVPEGITNPSFESGLTGWDVSGSAALSGAGGFSGPACISCSGAPGAAAIDTPFPVVPGQSITAQCQIRAFGGSFGNLGDLNLQWLDSLSAPISDVQGPQIQQGNGSTYRTATVTGIAPAGAAFVVLRADASPAGGGTVLFDTFSWNYIAPPSTAGLIYKAVQPATGASGATEPVWPTTVGVQVVDNEVIWEAMAGTRVVWEAHPILVSDSAEPDWPVEPDGTVADGTIRWRAFPRVITDPKCPHTKVVAIMEGHVFAVDDDIVPFSAANAPRDWTTPEDAGFLNVGLNSANSHASAVLAPYRRDLSIFSASTFALYQMDADPALMIGIDQMEGIGSTFPKCAVADGENLYFLTDMGARSVNRSVASRNLGSGDFGAPIDDLVRRSIFVAAANEKEPFAGYYPGLGQYLLAFGGDPVDQITVAGALPDGRIGEGTDGFRYVAVGGVGPKVFALAPGSLPLDPGLTLNPDGTVTGERTGPAQLYGPWEVIATDIEGLESEPWEDAAETLPELLVITGSAPDSFVGEDYTYSYQITGGVPPYSDLTVPAGALPDGAIATLIDDEIEVAGVLTTDETAEFTLSVDSSDYQTATKEDDIIVSAADVLCSAESFYEGGASYPTEIEIGLGSGTGNVVLRFTTGGVPDKFEVWYEGVKVIDPGYYGDTSYQEDLDDWLDPEPPETITQRTGTSEGGPGTTSAEQDWLAEDWEEFSFYKATPGTTATVKVYAPLGGTAWYFALLCPDGAPPP